MSSEQYWRNQLAQSEAEYEQIIQGLRDELEKQRRRCSELMHDQAMQRATAAADVRDFCTQYVAEAKQQQHHRNPTATAATPMAHHPRNKENVDSVPLPALLSYLREYSHGLLQIPENRRKRERSDTAFSPLHHRLRQRMLARHRLVGREDYVLEEGGEGQEARMSGGDASSAGSLCSPPMGPTSGSPRSGPRFKNAAAFSPSGTRSNSIGLDCTSSSAFVAAAAGVNERKSNNSSSSDNAERLGGGGAGDGGPVMAASAFGLPTLPPR